MEIPLHKSYRQGDRVEIDATKVTGTVTEAASIYGFGFVEFADVLGPEIDPVTGQSIPGQGKLIIKRWAVSQLNLRSRKAI